MLQEQIEVGLMNKGNVRILGREFELDVSFQNYPGEKITESQLSTLQMVQTVDYDSAKDGVKEYIRTYFSNELGDDNLDNIFRFVMPKSILIPREEKPGKFAILCNFKLDMEHGIAVVFENWKYKTAGPQDLIL